MKQAIEIAKTLRGIAAGLVSAVSLVGLGYIIGGVYAVWVYEDAKWKGAKEERSKNRSYYGE